MSFENIKKCKYLEWFWHMTEGIILLTWKRKIKHYIEDLIFFKLQKIKLSLKNAQSGKNKFKQKSIKNVFLDFDNRVIPYENTEKNMIFVFGFLTKKF